MPGAPAGPDRILVVHNPAAGRRRRRRFEEVLRRLRAAGIEPVVRATEGPGHAERLARGAARADFRAVVAAGGDGTLNEAANGLGAGSPPLGVIPLGTANVFAWEMGIPPVPGAVAAAIAGGRTRTVRPGEVNGRRFLQMAGIGFDARAVAGVDPALKRRFGKGAYVWSGLRTLLRRPFPPLRGEVAGAPFEARSLIACKGRLYGGRFVMAPDADPGRASFEVVLMPRGGTAAMLRCGAALALGRLSRLPGVRCVAAPEVAVTDPPGEPVQADGDIVARTPATVRITAAPLEVLAPAGGARQRASAPA